MIAKVCWRHCQMPSSRAFRRPPSHACVKPSRECAQNARSQRSRRRSRRNQIGVSSRRSGCDSESFISSRSRTLETDTELRAEQCRANVEVECSECGFDVMEPNANATGPRRYVVLKECALSHAN